MGRWGSGGHGSSYSVTRGMAHEGLWLEVGLEAPQPSWSQPLPGELLRSGLQTRQGLFSPAAWECPVNAAGATLGLGMPHVPLDSPRGTRGPGASEPPLQESHGRPCCHFGRTPASQPASRSLLSCREADILAAPHPFLASCEGGLQGLEPLLLPPTPIHFIFPALQTI